MCVKMDGRISINFTVSRGNGVFLRFRRTFAEVIMFDEASAHEFQPNFLVSAFEINILEVAQLTSWRLRA